MSTFLGTDKGEAIIADLSREVVKEGWLQKTGPKGTGWKKRWVILHDNRLLSVSRHPLLSFEPLTTVSRRSKVLRIGMGRDRKGQHCYQ
eukprot:m.196202 g.196202  ORF g.196202 m.196202 type:complete len:89 (+) comp15248_c0_seq1:185-451(+)